MTGTSPNIFRSGAELNAGLFDEMIVDNFAGAGGASMGIEAAIGRAVDVAINHDKHSIWMHQINHPNTRHLCEDVWDVDPLEATAGRRVGLAWFSPDCRHFSRAKGGKPVEKKIRGLAWIVIKWARLVKPRVIILENVREFQDWGPLTSDNRPCQKRKGQTFKRWRTTLENLGYVVEHRILNAADFGAPTHRRRFFLIARCDGRPITWPEPTHGPGRNHRYRTAAQCIDWSLPCPSIFLTKAEAKPLGVIRPLAEKTMRRIAMGLKRYVLDNPKPFIVTCNHSGPEFRGQGVDEPMKTVTGARDAHGVVMPSVVPANGDIRFCPHCGSTKGWGKGAKCKVCGQVPYAIGPACTPYVAGVGGRTGQGNVPCSAGDAPLGTVTAKNDLALVTPLLVEVQNGSNETGHRTVDRPAHTITANPKGGGVALVTPFLSANYGEAPHQDTRGQSVADPINTVTPANNTGVLISPTLIQYNTEKGDEKARGQSLKEPLKTVTTENRFAVVAPHVTNMTQSRQSLAAAFLAKNYGGVVGHGPERPLGTVTAVDHHSVVASHLVHMNHGEKQASGMNEPLRTITAGGNHAAEVRAFLIKYFGCGCGQEVNDPLHTVTGRDRFGLVTIEGQDFQIVDIGLRMLTPAELLRAQFGKYAKGYVLLGTKAQQVAKIGNSVPPELAEAVVRANFAEEVEVAA